MVSPGYRMMLLAAAAATIRPMVSQEVGGPVGVETVGVLVGRLVKHHLKGCHLVLLTATQNSPVFTSILRRLSSDGRGVVTVDAGSADSQVDEEQLLHGLWGDTRTTCRALILDLTSGDNRTHVVFGLAEASGLWQLSETRVLVVGETARVEAVLMHPSLRNTHHAIYLATEDHVEPRQGTGAPLRKGNTLKDELNTRVWVFQRCLYCGDGDMDIQWITVWNRTSIVEHETNLFQDQFRDMMGHRFQAITVTYFPYMDYQRDSDEPGTTVTLKDSVDARLLSALAATMNCTYEIREEPNRSWGVEKDGVFDGMMGLLQREEKDFCTISGPSPGRLRAIEYARGYPSDMVTVTSLKPTLLPQQLSLIRPFEGELWLALVLSVVAWGIIQWLMQRVWRWAAGGPGLRLSTSLLYGWGALLEHPPPDPSVSLTGQLLVGWWLVFCLIITTGFRSSLIAHLTVQGKSQPIDTLEDLVGMSDWRWGCEAWLLKGVPLEYFSRHTDPTVKKIYMEMEVLDGRDALYKVLAGGYSFISFKNYISVIVASQHADERGYIPFHISNKGIYILAAFGWGFRKGAPFYPRFSQLMNRLEDGGLISYWTEEVIARRVRDNRKAKAQRSKSVSPEDSTEEALGLQHLQGAFYLMFLGSSLAFLSFLGENLAYSCHQ